MAVKRFLEKPKTFEFEGMNVGVRQPNTGEMLTITKARQAYIKTVHADPYQDGEGEISEFIELQLETSKLLACDPDDASNPWFAEDKEDQDRLRKNGVDKNTADELPHRFHAALWNALTGAGGDAPLEVAKVTENPPETTENLETTSDSTASLSESASTSDVPSETFSSGPGTDSSTESNA